MPGPAYGDITLVRAQIIGRDLVLTMGLDAAPPRAGRANAYAFEVDVDRDGSGDFRLSLLYPRDGQLQPSFFSLAGTSVTRWRLPRDGGPQRRDRARPYRPRSSGQSLGGRRTGKGAGAGSG